MSLRFAFAITLLYICIGSHMSKIKARDKHDKKNSLIIITIYWDAHVTLELPAPQQLVGNVSLLSTWSFTSSTQCSFFKNVGFRQRGY